MDRLLECQESIYYISGSPVNVMSNAPAQQTPNKKDLEFLILAVHLDEPCLQKLADYEGKKRVSIQKADLKSDETKEEKTLLRSTPSIRRTWRF